MILYPWKYCPNNIGKHMWEYEGRYRFCNSCGYEEVIDYVKMVNKKCH